MLIYPQIDPVLVEIGPIVIRWYALAYIGGILLGWRYALRLARKPPRVIEAPLIDDFLLILTLGIVLGGRLGYVLFYKPAYYLHHPLEILQVWSGGMSFHGGMLGVVIAIVLFTRKHKISLLGFGDIVAMVVPIGLALGRIANFINGELWGRASTMPWAMVFPHADALPRHPSQLYQAALEGIVLLIVLALLERRGWRQYPGAIAGAFLVGYGIARIIGELFREPDAFLGFLPGGLTMGQVLSLPMIAAGAWLIRRAFRVVAA